MEFWELIKYLSLHLILELEAHGANSWEGKTDKCGGGQKQAETHELEAAGTMGNARQFFMLV